MVLPANISQGLQAMLAGPSVANGSGAGGGGSVIVNISAYRQSRRQTVLPTVMEPCWSMLSTEPRANGSFTADRLIGVDLPGPPRARVERYQVPDVSERASSGRYRGENCGPSITHTHCGNLRWSSIFYVTTRRQVLTSCENSYGVLYAVPGCLRHVLVQDPSDDRVSGQQIGTGDTLRTIFQLQRTMGETLPGGGFLEPILAPNVVSAVYFNGIIQDPAGYSVDSMTGARDL